PGTLAVGVAQVVALPVPTLVDTFAWTTSALVLARLRRKAALVAGADAPDALPAVSGAAVAAAGPVFGGETVLGPFVATAAEDAATTRWATWLSGAALPQTAEHAFFLNRLRTHLLAVGDTLLAGISSECTEITARVQLGQAKTVVQGPSHTE